ncbi:MAG: filamentous hemagglutinin N-terminal domain-containing protein [Chlamydiota bacterium]|jgi:filamentous hemagglutinin family protein
MVRTLCISLFFFLHLFANPTGESIVSGNLNINSHKNQLDIHQTSKKAIIEWKDFSIELGERVNIHQKFSNGVILNRVIGNCSSKILGTLESNGLVYLINEQGIFIGKQGKVQTKGFLASCLSLKNEPFLQGKTLFFEGDKQGELVNLGSIKTSTKHIFLLAQVVKNEGKIHAQKGNSYLIGSNQLYLTEDNQIFVNSKSIGTVENRGSIKAVEAQLEAAGGSIYSCAINQTGIVEANGIEKINGKIILKAHSNLTDVSGSLIAQSQDKGGAIQVTGGDEIHLQDTAKVLANGDLGGGEVLIGGDYQGKNPSIENTKKIWVNKKAVINADAIIQGNGGKVVIWADEQNLFGGTISAKGGRIKGDGGFIEVSAKEYLLYKGSAFTNAFNGKTGNLLLDPSDITISTSASSPAFPTSPGNYNPTGASATLNVSDLVNVTDGLGNNNVTVSTSGGTGGSGIVTFANDVTWSANTTLTVLADQAIIVNSGVSLSNTSTASNFTAFDFRGNEAGGSTANSIGIDIVGSISTVNGNINLVGQGGTSASNFGVYLRNTSTGLSSSGSGANAGTITIDGTGGSGASDCYGAYIQGSGDRITSIDGNISVTGVGGGDGTSTGNIGILMSDGAAVRSTGTTTDAATITFAGTGGSGTSNNHGIEITGTSCGISSSVGNISLTGDVDTPSSSTNYGIYINSAGFIESTGTTSDAATITLNGTGAGTSSGRGITFLEVSSFTSVNGDISLTGVGTGGGTSSDGVVMRNTTISSTGTGASAANITIDGTSNGSSGSGCEFFTSSGAISVAGNINISGTGAGGAEQGFDMTSSSAFVGNGSTQGDITIIANTINLAGDAQSSGVLTIQPDTVAGTMGLGDSSSGTLNLTNTELSNIQNGFSEIIFGRTDGTGAIDVRAFTYTDPITIQSLSGTITINGALAAGANAITLSSDSMAIDNSVTGTSTLTIQPGQASTTIGLGTGATGTLNLTDTELGNLTNGFSSITFGSTTGTGAVDMQAFTYSDPIIVYGGTISANGIVATGGSDNITFNIGSAGAGTLNLNANVNAAGTFTVNGGSNNDAFNINVTSQTATLIGNGGTNTLTGPNASNTWAITSDNGGTLNTSIGFSDMQNLTGNANNDAFTFNGAFQITGTIDGSTGTNTLTGPNVNNAWAVTSTDTGSITPTGAGGATSFSNIGNLTGGSSNDSFVLSDGVGVSGAIDGTSSTGNALSYAAYTTSVSVNLQTGAATNITGGVSNIQTFTGGSNTDTITGTNTTNAWSITADDTSSLNNGSTTFTLNSFENLTGGSGNDTFTFNGAFQITGTIDGSIGSNTINGPNVNNVWAVTSQTTGTLTPTGASGSTSYSNIGSLVGNASDDTFNLSADITLPSITAGAGTDTLNFLAGWTIPATINLNTVTGFEVINGPPGLDNTLVGNNLSNTWTITAADAGTLENTDYPSPAVFTFSNFPNITGGSANDSFDFTAGFTVTSIDGSTGSNALLAPNTANTWNITDDNTGTVASISFANITDLTGGTLSDTFVFANQKGVSGQVDGGAPASLNTLDYSAFSPAATVIELTATSGTASNLGSGYINIGNIIGNITSGSVITAAIQQKSNFYFANLQLLFTELYHCRLIPEFFYRQFEKMKYVQEPQEKIQIKRKR